MNQEAHAKKMRQIIAKAWMDEGFKKRLLAAPATMLKEEGVEIPAGVEVRMVEDTDKVCHLVLPTKPSIEELSDEQLANVAAGWDMAEDGPGTSHSALEIKNIRAFWNLAIK